MSVEDGQTLHSRKTLMTDITYCKVSEFRISKFIANIVPKKENFIAKDLQTSEVCAEVILASVEVI